MPSARVAKAAKAGAAAATKAAAAKKAKEEKEAAAKKKKEEAEAAKKAKAKGGKKKKKKGDDSDSDEDEEDEEEEKDADEGGGEADAKESKKADDKPDPPPKKPGLFACCMGGAKGPDADADVVSKAVTAPASGTSWMASYILRTPMSVAQVTTTNSIAGRSTSVTAIVAVIASSSASCHEGPCASRLPSARICSRRASSMAPAGYSSPPACS